MCTGQLRNRVLVLDIHLVVLHHTPPLDILHDGLSNGHLAGPLADFGQVSSRVTLRCPCNGRQVDISGNRTLPQCCLEDGDTRVVIWQRNVHELVEPSGTHDCGVEDVRSIGGANDKDVLPRTNTINLGKDLVDNTVTGTAGVACRGPTSAGNGVQLVKEQHARRGLTSLVKHLTHVRLGLSKPHGEKLGTLDGDEVGLALVGNGLCEERLSASRGSVEQHSLRWLHSKLLKHFRMLHGVLYSLLKLEFDRLEASNVVPGDIWYLHGHLSERGRVARTKGESEVILCDTELVQHLGVDRLVLQVDQVHFLTNTLESGFRTELGQICSDKTMSLLGNLLQVDIGVQLHVLCVDP
mmetsp:Transcript_2596/g.7814  ORF Transcript_2596/g.7814 Transcript_2596/m.7814 type:complete len:353 (+) Transcript_2596:315-1373(+)